MVQSGFVIDREFHHGEESFRIRQLIIRRADGGDEGNGVDRVRICGEWVEIVFVIALWGRHGRICPLGRKRDVGWAIE